MKHIKYFGLLFVFSCSDTESISTKNETVNSVELSQNLNQLSDASDTLLIELDDDISFNWNTKSSQIIEDSSYTSILSRFDGIKMQLVDQVLNESVIPLQICDSKKIRKGDLVFLLISKIKEFPNPIHAQLDVFKENCKFPVGYFEAINNDRVGISERVRNSIKLK